MAEVLHLPARTIPALPFDVARCNGSEDEHIFESICHDCRRREPGNPERQVQMAPQAASTPCGGLVACAYYVKPGF